MKVYLSNYRDHWLSPYTILEKVMFWREIDYDEPVIERWSNRLNPFCEALQKVLDFIHPRINYVKIDRYDSWNAHNTASKILLPLLTQLQQTKHGYGFVDDEDVPDSLKSSNSEPRTQEEIDCGHTDSNFQARYEWMLNEVLFALKSDNEDWEEQFWKQHPEIDFTKHPEDEGKLIVPVRWKVDGIVDWEGRQAYQERISNGFRLMGKYWQSFWD